MISDRPPFVRLLSAIGVSACIAAGAGAAPLQAATSSTVVSATVPSATNLTATGCASGTSATDFGVVLPGSSAVTSVDCALTFGSSNDSSMLRIAQEDTYGSAMFQATRGTPDGSFNATGAATTSFGPGANTDQATSVGVQGDGSIVTAGTCDMGAVTGYDFCLARYLPTGSPDPAWGGAGKVTTTVAPGANYDEATTVEVQRDGKVLAAGTCDVGGGNGQDFCVTRYLAANGGLDPSWGAGGRVTTTMAPANGTDVVDALLEQADGSIIAVGHCNMGAGSGNDICSARYSSTGVLDTTWGAGVGKVFTAIGPGANTDTATGAVIQPDGKVVAAGWCNMGAVTGYDMCSVRYGTLGALDGSWGGTGKVTTPIAAGTGGDSAYDLAIQPDGKIVAAGGCDIGGATGTDLCLVRYDALGGLDPSFGGTGKVSTAIATGAATDEAWGVAVQPDGAVLVAGGCSMGGSTGVDVCLARYTRLGALDTTFNATGKVTTSVAPLAGSDSAASVALRPDGRVVAAGGCAMGGATGNDQCVTTYAGGGTVSQYAPGAADWTSLGTNAFAACLHATGGGALAQWTQDATCAAANGTWWNAVPTAPTKVAYTAGPNAVATAGLRFGMRTASAQLPGAYVAPLNFEVLAPNV